MQKRNCILILYLFMFALNLFLRRFRNEFAHSLTNGNYFSSLVYVCVTVDSNNGSHYRVGELIP